MNRADTVDRHQRGVVASAVLLLACFTACAGPKEAPRVRVPVIADGAGITPCTTNLGYTVTLHTARMVIEDLEFAAAGEVHTGSRLDRVGAWFVSTAHAHPGHYHGGEVIGSLPGHFLVDWIDAHGAALGTADLLEGAYTSANFTFARATVEDVGSADGVWVDHTAMLSGTWSKDGAVGEFVAIVDSPEGRQLVGLPFSARVSGDAPVVLGLQLLTIDPLQQDTLFDDIEFAELAAGSDGIRLTSLETDLANVDAYNQLLRTFQTHDHFRMEVMMASGGDDP